MEYHQARHLHRQRICAAALERQDVVVLTERAREDLSWDLARATAPPRTWDTVHAALLAELDRHDHDHDHDQHTVRALAEIVTEAVHRDPEPPFDSFDSYERTRVARRRGTGAAPGGGFFTIEPWGEDPEADRSLVRAVLERLHPWASYLRSALPPAAGEHWPDDVAAAAVHLLSASARPRGGDGAGVTTGWLPADDTTWEAHVVVAPYALGSSVLTDGVGRFIDVDDRAALVALRLDGEQQDLVVRALGGRHLRRLRREPRLRLHP